MIDTNKETPTSHNSFVHTSEASNEQALAQQAIVQSWSTDEERDLFISKLRDICMIYEKYVLSIRDDIASYVLTEGDKLKIEKYRSFGDLNFKYIVCIMSNLMDRAVSLNRHGYNAPIQNILELSVAKLDYIDMCDRLHINLNRSI